MYRDKKHIINSSETKTGDDKQEEKTRNSIWQHFNHWQVALLY